MDHLDVPNLFDRALQRIGGDDHEIGELARRAGTAAGDRAIGISLA